MGGQELQAPLASIAGAEPRRIRIAGAIASKWAGVATRRVATIAPHVDGGVVLVGFATEAELVDATPGILLRADGGVGEAIRPTLLQQGPRVVGRGDVDRRAAVNLHRRARCGRSPPHEQGDRAIFVLATVSAASIVHREAVGEVIAHRNASRKLEAKVR